MILKKGYKHFNLLLDICFWFQLYANAKALGQQLAWLPRPFYPETWWGDLLYGAHIVLFGATFFGMYLLLLVRRLRDEYAERLWQKSASGFSALLIVLPVLWIASWETSRALGYGPHWLRDQHIGRIGPDFANLGEKMISVGYHQIEGIDLVLFEMFQLLPLMFIAIYKWHRWRDQG